MNDIVLATCDRLELLKRTLQSIWTNTPVGSYRLHVIDDGSREGNVVFLREAMERGQINTLTEHRQRLGIAANLRQIYKLTTSDLVIYCDDDQLAPAVSPSWLTRLLSEMAQRPRQAILSLNNPHGNVGGDKRRRLRVDGKVTLCERSGGSFLCIRRELLPQITPPDGLQSPVSWMCLEARRLGYENGYLTHTYTQHIGTRSIRWNTMDHSAEINQILPVNAQTLEPPEAYRV